MYWGVLRHTEKFRLACKSLFYRSCLVVCLSFSSICDCECVLSILQIKIEFYKSISSLSSNLLKTLLAASPFHFIIIIYNACISFLWYQSFVRYSNVMRASKKDNPSSRNQNYPNLSTNLLYKSEN